MTPPSNDATDLKRPGSNGKQRVTPEDIENKLREFAGPVEDNVQKAESMAIAVGVAIGAVLVIAAFVYGRRRGRKRTPVVEIRRI